MSEKVKCPKCGGKVLVSPKNYYCEDFHGPEGDPDEDCNFILWRNDLAKLGKAEISESEIMRLLVAETIRLKLKNKEGKSFECDGKLAEIDAGNGRKKWKIQFVFNQPKVLGED